MAKGNDEPRIYEALALPPEALDNGGAEILRVGIIGEDLFVTARPAFRDAGKWGEVLAEVAERLGAIYAAELAGMSKKDVTVQIVEAFAAAMGAKPVKPSAARKPSKKVAKKIAKKPAKKSAAKRKKR